MQLYLEPLKGKLGQERMLLQLALSVLSLLPLPLDMNLLELIMGLCLDINLDMLLLPA